MNIKDSRFLFISTLVTLILSQPSFASNQHSEKGVSDKSVSEFYRYPGEKKEKRSSDIRPVFWNAVSSALNKSAALNSARMAWEASEESVNEAKGQRWPQVNVGTNSRAAKLSKGERSTDDQLATFYVNMTTSLYDFGKLDNTIKSRVYKENAAKLGIRLEMENVAWQVSTTMIELSKERQIREIAREYINKMTSLVTMLKGIVESDVGRRSELTQAMGKLLQAQSQFDNADARVRDYEIVLERYLGDSLPQLPKATVWQVPMQNIEKQLLQVDEHPQIMQAIANARAARSEADATRSSGLPTLNWVVNKNTARDDYGRSQAFETGIQVNWGLFSGGSTLAAEKAALLRAQASDEQANDQLQELKKKVKAASQDAKTGLQRADLYHDFAQVSDKIRSDFYEQWYHLGKRTLLDVLSAENDYFNNRINEVTNRFNAYNAIFKSHADSGTLIPWLNMQE